MKHVARRVVCPAGAEALALGISLLHQEGGVAVTLDLRPLPVRSPALEDLGYDPEDLARLRGALDPPVGLGIVTGPPAAGGSTTLACLLAEAGSADRRCLAFGTAAARVPAEMNVPGPSADVAGAWAEVVVAQCADIVALDGVLAGSAVAEALSPEAAGRLLLVRTDWTDTFALLEQLAARPQERAALAERLRFVIQQRLPRADQGASPADPSGLQGDRRAVFEVLVAGDSLREALRAGAPAARLRACAEADGFRPLAARLEALVASGRVSPREAERHAA